MGSTHSKAIAVSAVSEAPDAPEAAAGLLEPPRAGTPLVPGGSFLFPVGSPVEVAFASSCISFRAHPAKSTPPPPSALFQVFTPSASRGPSMLDMPPQCMLDMLPYPAVMVEPAQCRPIAANSGALALFGSTDLADLQRLFAADLWGEELLKRWTGGQAAVEHGSPAVPYPHVFASSFVMPDDKVAVMYSFFGNTEGSSPDSSLWPVLAPLSQNHFSGAEDPNGARSPPSPAGLYSSMGDPRGSPLLHYVSPSSFSQHPLSWDVQGRLHGRQ